MGVLNKIEEMKKKGMQDDQIIQRLREEGNSPREIQDAFNQEQIKNAVDSENGGYGEMPHQRQDDGGSFYTPKTREMDENQNYDQNYYSPENTGEEVYTPQYAPEEYQEGYNAGGLNTDTIIEIAEQVFSEKIKKIEKKLDQLSEFANLAQTKITNNNERIKRIESVMDKMQIAILDKIGSYGKNLENIKNEMQMMEDSFSKVLPELAKKHKKK